MLLIIIGAGHVYYKLIYDAQNRFYNSYKRLTRLITLLFFLTAIDSSVAR